MPNDALIKTIEESIDLVRQIDQACAQRGHPAPRYSPTDRLRGRETESREQRAVLDQAVAAIGDLREPIADALERASIDSTPWLRFIAQISGPDQAPGCEPILELLQRLQRRVRLGLVPE